jgi:hypothetical protein
VPNFSLCITVWRVHGSPNCCCLWAHRTSQGITHMGSMRVHSTQNSVDRFVHSLSILFGRAAIG